MRFGVVLEAFPTRTLVDTLDLLTADAESVHELEVGVGGFGASPHCDPQLLLRDDAARESWASEIGGRGFRVSALNASGNVLDPDSETARRHDRDLRDAIRLAAALGVDRVVAMAGCPPGAPGDRTPHFAGGRWLPYLDGIDERQWEEAVIPYWSALSEFARAEHPEALVCIELHPGSCVYNLETFERFAAIGDNLAANLDPSHLFWQQMDPLAVVSKLSRIGHAHAKDVVFNPEPLALNGLLDRRWTTDDPDAPWTFAVVGRGHRVGWWRAFLDALQSRGVESISIEHEDPTICAEAGVRDAAAALARAAEGLSPAGRPV